MVKQPACAAAISSSGLVPTPLSKREPNEYWVSLRVVLWVVMLPLPSLSPPCQMALAVRSMRTPLVVRGDLAVEKMLLNYDAPSAPMIRLRFGAGSTEIRIFSATRSVSG